MPVRARGRRVGKDRAQTIATAEKAMLEKHVRTHPSCSGRDESIVESCDENGVSDERSESPWNFQLFVAPLFAQSHLVGEPVDDLTRRRASVERRRGLG